MMMISCERLVTRALSIPPTTYESAHHMMPTLRVSPSVASSMTNLRSLGTIFRTLRRYLTTSALHDGSYHKVGQGYGYFCCIMVSLD